MRGAEGKENSNSNKVDKVKMVIQECHVKGTHLENVEHDLNANNEKGWLHSQAIATAVVRIYAAYATIQMKISHQSKRQDLVVVLVSKYGKKFWITLEFS